MDNDTKLNELIARQNLTPFSAEAREAIDCALGLQRERDMLRNAIGEARAWFDFYHLNAVVRGETNLSGDAVRDLRYAYDKLGNALCAKSSDEPHRDSLKPTK